MPDIVLVLLVELVVRHARAVHLAPERDGLVEREPDALGPGQRAYTEVVRGEWALSDATCLGLEPPELAPCSRIQSTGSGIRSSRLPRSPLFAGPESRTQDLLHVPRSKIQDPQFSIPTSREPRIQNPEHGFCGPDLFPDAPVGPPPPDFEKESKSSPHSP
jgi:hypothetical protein